MNDRPYDFISRLPAKIDQHGTNNGFNDKRVGVLLRGRGFLHPRTMPQPRRFVKP